MSHSNGKWDIDPVGVNSVVTKTGTIAEGLVNGIQAYAKHLQSAASSAGTLSWGSHASQAQHHAGNGHGGKDQQPGGLVANALAQFAQATKPTLEFIAERSSKSLNAAGEATKAYLTGDERMAAQAKKDMEGTTAPAIVPPARGAK